MLLTVKRGTHIAWKVLPGSSVEESAEKCFHAQTPADWSAIYAQLTIEHAVSYLNNHYDRGNEWAHLVSISAARDIQCTIYSDERMAANDLTPHEKAVLLRTYLNEQVCAVPLTNDSLMKSVGEQLGIFVVIPDSESLLECVIPHSLMDNAYFSFRSHATFHRDELNPCLTRFVRVAAALPLLDSKPDIPLSLCKDEMSDPALLGMKLAKCDFGAFPAHCSWISTHLSHAETKGKTEANLLFGSFPDFDTTAESKDRLDDVLPLFSNIVMTPMARVRDSEKSSDDAVIRRVTMSEAAEIASYGSLSVKTLPRRPRDYNAGDSAYISRSLSMEANNIIIASDGKEYLVAPLCLPPPAEIAKFLREMKVKREQGYFRMVLYLFNAFILLMTLFVCSLRPHPVRYQCRHLADPGIPSCLRSGCNRQSYPQQL